MHVASDEKTFQDAFVLYSEVVLIENGARELFAARPVLDPQLRADVIEDSLAQCQAVIQQRRIACCRQVPNHHDLLLLHLALGSIDKPWNPSARSNPSCGK